MPQVVGAVDGKHIEILAPSSESEFDYFSRKKKYTINSQTFVGSNLMFLDVSTGFPSNAHHDVVLVWTGGVVRESFVVCLHYLLSFYLLPRHTPLFSILTPHGLPPYVLKFMNFHYF